MAENRKIWDFRGSFTAVKDPFAAAKLRRRIFHPWVCRGEVVLRSGEVVLRSGEVVLRSDEVVLRSGEVVLRNGEATVHSTEMLCFCFVLFFQYPEYSSIGLMRIL